MAWIIPNEIQQGRNYSTLSDKDLIYNHGQLHIFWKKLEEGYPLAWTFEKIYEEHSKTVNELSKRKISHLASINELDDVQKIEAKSEKLSQKFAYSVEKKLRGLQVNVHKKDNEVKIFSEENELTEIFPKIVENVKKISMSNFAIDGEIILYDNEKILSRNELNKRIESNQILEDVKLFVWDIPYYNEPIDEFLLKDRIKLFDKFRFNERVLEIDRKLVSNEIELKKAVEWANSLPDSKGVIIKDLISFYCCGESPVWKKYKKLIELSVSIIKKIDKKRNYNYLVGINANDKYLSEDYLQDGKLILGHTIGTSKSFEVGDNIKINVEEIWKHSDDKGIHFSIYKPKVLEKTLNLTTVKELNGLI